MGIKNASGANLSDADEEEPPAGETGDLAFLRGAGGDTFSEG